MKNREVGYLIIGISIFIFLIIGLFNLGLKDIISASCSHGPMCGMYDTIRVQTWFGVIIAFLVLFIGLVLLFSKEEKEIVIKKIKEKNKRKKLDLSGLDSVEKKALGLIQKEGGLFQKTLMEELSVGKVKMTRLLDKLESKEIIERKRRGMNNFVVLKK